MTRYARAGLVLLALAAPMSLNAQTEVIARNVTLVDISSGMFVEANPDGTQALDPYSVPMDKELCLKDIAWHVVGAADADVELGLRNNNIDGTSSWVMWWIHPKLNSKGAAGGSATFAAGPQIRANGTLESFGLDLTDVRLAIYGIERPVPAPGTETACFP